MDTPQQSPDETLESPSTNEELDTLETQDLEEVLTARQAAFVREYCLCGNATQAAIRAGYSSKNAGTMGYVALRHPKVARAIEKRLAHMLSAADTKAQEVLLETKALALSSIEHYVISDDGQVTLAEGAPPNALSAIRTVKKKTRIDRDGSVTYDVEVQLWDKPGALKLMGKHAGIKAFFDKVEISGPDGGPIPITEIRNVIVDPAAPPESHGADS